MTDERQRYLGFYSLNETRDKNEPDQLLITPTRSQEATHFHRTDAL